MKAVGAVVWLGLSLEGCRYLQDPNPFEGLGQGDVTGILVGVPPGTQADSNVPLTGARVRLAGGVAVASTRDNGRFVLRNVAEGSHRLNLFYDPNRDGVPDLAALVTLAITIPPLRLARPSVNLGEVVLLKPGRIKGTVSVDGIPVGDPRLAHVYVVVREADVTVHVDPATMAFEVQGLGAGHWTLAAGYLDRASDDVGIDIHPDEEITLPPFTLRPASPGSGTITGTLQPPGEDAPTTIDFSTLPQPLDNLPRMVAALLPVDPALGGTTPSELDSSTATKMGMPFSIEARPGLYHLEIVFETTDVPPLRIPNIPVRAGATTDLGNLYAMWTKVGDCVDQDGDNRCWLDAAQGGTCVDECRQPDRDPEASCTQGGQEYDCDDDADTQADTEEQLGRPGVLPEGALPGPCRCSATGVLPDGTPTCDRDPTRSDRDGDGICDRYDAYPDCALNRAGCTRQGAPLSGVPTVFIPAAIRAGVVGDRSPFTAVSVSAINDDEVEVLADVGAAVSLPAPCADVTPPDAGSFFTSTATFMIARYGLTGTCVQRAVWQGDTPYRPDGTRLPRFAVVPSTGEAWVAGSVTGPSMSFEGALVL